ncbi:MAG: sensor domain-containing diguanylate cyclase [Pseudomonadota bacterium]
MLAAQEPDNEAARIDALNALNLLNSSPGERFDRLTRLAKRLFNVPVAKVSLVASDTVFALSCAGPVPAPVPRELSFCSHTILGDDILVVPDARLDERFHNSPFVTGEPYIRFYAGCPLAVPNGCKLGTLCLIDTVPRDFDEEDFRLLRDLAAMVEHELAAVQMATMDDLTKLSNRRGFEMLSQQAIHVCRRLDKSAALLFFDLNHFKSINDTYGHAEGDRALTVFSEVLRKVFRNSDLIGRLGGDEFVTLLINSNRLETEAALERLRWAVAARNTEDQRGYDICFSVGQVDFDPARHESITQMLAEGDTEMYRNKLALKAEAAPH